VHGCQGFSLCFYACSPDTQMNLLPAQPCNCMLNITSYQRIPYAACWVDCMCCVAPPPGASSPAGASQSPWQTSPTAAPCLKTAWRAEPADTRKVARTFASLLDVMHCGAQEQLACEARSLHACQHLPLCQTPQHDLVTCQAGCKARALHRH
jgi:hypothetical protein